MLYQYYAGANSTIYLASVQNILDSVITGLLMDSSKKYTLCEISFFSRWWNDQNAQRKADVKRLLKNKQLQFVNGAWVMHDEASAHYVSMIDQTTLGHRFLKDELDYIPRVGWQIDPFGHSASHAWLSSEVGFDALYFGRIDFQDHNLRKKERRLEMVWKGSASDPSAEVFTGVFSSGNYGAPAGFCFDSSCSYCRDDPVIDDKRLETYNMDAKTQGFIDAILDEKSMSVGNHIMLKMGSDFAWDNAQTWFKSVDKLINKINAVRDDMELFWSDPVTYTEARAAEDLTWTQKTDDFFPYSDCQHCFWAGYFTSRPTLKGFERTSSQLLQSLKQLTSSSTVFPDSLRTEADSVIFDLTAAVGLVNHHDAITGTSKQHVAYDYIKILSAAVTRAEDLLSKVMTKVLLPSLEPKSTSSMLSLGLSMCRQMNETACAVSQGVKEGESLLVLAYNPLPRTRTQRMSVFLSDTAVSGLFHTGLFRKSHVSVFRVDKPDSEPVLVKSSLVQSTTTSPNPSAAPWTLYFDAENVPALSTSRFLVKIGEPTNVEAAAELLTVADEKSLEDHFTLSNDKVSVSFNKKTGLMETITRLDTATPVTASVSNDLAYYNSFGSKMAAVEDHRDPHLQNLKPAAHHYGSVSSQASGAYIFRPESADEPPKRVVNCNAKSPLGGKVEIQVVKGKQGNLEVRQKFNTWASQVVRLAPGDAAVEVEWTVGPVPINDGYGKEIVSKFTSSLKTGGTGANVAYTDSNGREFLKRTLNSQPTYPITVYEPIAGNYYPISTAIYVQDVDAKLQLSVLPDRSQAGASINDGEIELMVHRRLVADDQRGVNEPLNETTGGMSPYPTWERSGDGITVRGKHYLLLSSLENGMAEVRQKMDEVFAPLTTFYSSDPNAVKAALLSAGNDQSLLSTELPVNVQLVTLEAISNTKLLVRLAHQFAVNEDPNLSQDVTVDIFALLAKYNPKSIQEMTLSANQDKAEQMAGKIQWKSTGAITDGRKQPPATKLVSDNGVVTISPMQIRTFYVTIEK